MEARIMIVDDDLDFLDLFARKLAECGFSDVWIEDSPERAAARFKAGERFDIAMVDMTMPEMEGIELVEKIKAASPRTECIMVTAVNEARVAVECLRRGAYDYLVKPIPKEDLALSLSRTLERRRLMALIDLGKQKKPPQLRHPEAFEKILTRSPKMMRLLKEAELHAASDVPVLITGESGTGKELLARAIHAASPRAAAPFLPVNMASVAGSLFEAEFFGHTKGAFTGAEKERAGYLSSTNRGTLFLDEIGNLPPEHQGKLLRVLQDGEFARLGSSVPKKVDIRIIAATNEDLEALIARKRFRPDLYYRIRGGWLHLPPLRERPEDIPLLAEHFLGRTAFGAGGVIEEEALCLLMEYPFPGNVRELMSILQSAANLARGRPVAAADLPREVASASASRRCRPPAGHADHRPLAAVEQDHILSVYRATGRNKARTARTLGIGLNTLRRKLRGYGEG
ncbi:MAG: sigma-54 dependent transcriptional regulator [Desulfobacterales bacterium]|nr:sigma-54 dependent transcriptional regulator [Desulfobacterales bacterium]MCF8079675.1 sigma-54 dependent transcriptional regulator [Desulfobacterales bacterium]